MLEIKFRRPTRPTVVSVRRQTTNSLVGFQREQRRLGLGGVHRQRKEQVPGARRLAAARARSAVPRSPSQRPRPCGPCPRARRASRPALRAIGRRRRRGKRADRGMYVWIGGFLVRVGPGAQEPRAERRVAAKGGVRERPAPCDPTASPGHAPPSRRTSTHLLRP